MQASAPRPLMVLGTSSGAGKSLMTAALCRVLHRRGETPLPFKGQNMALNSFITKEGGEIGRAQALQALAAGLAPHTDMNPVLLKPQGDSTSEVIHLGQSVGTARAEHYYRDWFRPGWAAIRQGLRELQADQPGGRLVLEGAGSPVEVNLQSRDLTNLRLAQFLRANCLLVADIERGGVFAQLVGTLQLLRPVERPLIRGLLINRFRGRRELFDEGRRWLESHTGIPVLGVMPRSPLLRSVTVEELARRLDARVLCCRERLDLLVETLSIGAMNVNSAMEFFRRRRNMAVVTGADRTDIQLAALEASTQCLILTGAGEPLPQLISRAEELDVPLLKVEHDTLTTVEVIERTFGHVRLHESVKATYAFRLVEEHCDFERLYTQLQLPVPA